MKNKRVVVGLSGGVDSAAVVKLLKKKGYEVAGVFLQMHKDGEKLYRVTYGGASQDIKSAYQCAVTYDIPLYVYNAKESFDKYVISDFLNEYSHGRTPNPCTVCNFYCKIASLIEAADLLHAEFVATGHYASIGSEDGRFYPGMAKDTKKDQSYMLWRLSQDQLKRLIFPLNNKTKQQIKEFAHKDSLLAAQKKESVDICFLPNGDYAGFIEEKLGKFPQGDFVLPDGTVTGKHKGIIHYTIGQRKGLNISYSQPLFVKKIDAEENKIYLGIKGQEYAGEFCASGINYCLFPPKKKCKINCEVKVRYAAPLVPCEVQISGERLKVSFKEPQRAITPGQSAVFYKDGKVLFGAIID